MRNLPKREALPRAETQKWLNRLKPFFSEEPNISRFDASDYGGVAGYGLGFPDGWSGVKRGACPFTSSRGEGPFEHPELGSGYRPRKTGRPVQGCAGRWGGHAARSRIRTKPARISTFDGVPRQR